MGKKEAGGCPAQMIKEQHCQQHPYPLLAGALICIAISCLHLRGFGLAAFIAQEGATAALRDEGSEDSFQSVFLTSLYFLKHSAKPRLTPQVSSLILSREAEERHLNSLRLKREMS